jgi:hypothetical protein
MTHRIELEDWEETTLIAFEGLLDRSSLEDVLSSVRDARWNGAKRVLLSLGAGTEVEGECIDKLRQVDGLHVKASSPFLERWLRQKGVVAHVPRRRDAETVTAGGGADRTPA